MPECSPRWHTTERRSIRLDVDEESVTFRYTPSKRKTAKTRDVTGEEFVRGFLQHVLLIGRPSTEDQYAKHMYDEYERYNGDRHEPKLQSSLPFEWKKKRRNQCRDRT